MYLVISIALGTKAQEQHLIRSPLLGRKVLNIATGNAHTLIVYKNGLVEGCGTNDRLELGIVLDEEDEDGNKQEQTNFSTPVPITFPEPICAKKAFAICNSSFVIARSGTVYAMGLNDEGQLGIGAKGTVVKTPLLIKGLENERIKWIGGGKFHSFMISHNGTLYGSGSNFWGKMTLGKNERGTCVPIVIPFFKHLKFSRVFCKTFRSIFLTENGEVYGAGYQPDKQLGVGLEGQQIYEARRVKLGGSDDSTNENEKVAAADVMMTSKQILFRTHNAPNTFHISGNMSIYNQLASTNQLHGNAVLFQPRNGVNTSLPIRYPRVGLRTGGKSGKIAQCIGCGDSAVFVVSDNGILFGFGKSASSAINELFISATAHAHPYDSGVSWVFEDVVVEEKNEDSRNHKLGLGYGKTRNKVLLPLDVARLRIRKVAESQSSRERGERLEFLYTRRSDIPIVVNTCGCFVQTLTCWC